MAAIVQSTAVLVLPDHEVYSASSSFCQPNILILLQEELNITIHFHNLLHTLTFGPPPSLTIGSDRYISVQLCQASPVFGL